MTLIPQINLDKVLLWFGDIDAFEWISSNKPCINSNVNRRIETGTK
ncbi:hypothetical protein IQ238_25200 [Pleurocapsales cyanobacterium LEGE 06147]|nr:hypothetical protein [Pleurocapsales cyanobacterium LEGE 06147]